MTTYRKKFVILFMTDPPSADILKECELEDFPKVKLEVGQVRKTKCDETLNGTILKIGTRTDLSKLNITQDGQVHESQVGGTRYVGSRKHELILIKRAQKRARESHLDNLSDGLVNFGVPGPALPANMPKKMYRGPKARPAETLDNIRYQLNHLPCLQFQHGDAALAGASNVFVNMITLHSINKQLAKKPGEMFRTLLREVIPVQLRKGGGLSYSGRKGTVAVPTKIIDAIEAHVSLNSEGEPYNIAELVRNALYYEENGPKKKPATTTAIPPGLGTEEQVNYTAHGTQELVNYTAHGTQELVNYTAHGTQEQVNYRAPYDDTQRIAQNNDDDGLGGVNVYCLDSNRVVTAGY